jgi:internalin A
MSNDGYKEALKRIDEAARENSLRLDLSALGLETVPEELFRLVNLQTLYLHSNKITAIPEAFGSLENLQKLSLHSNQIKEVPEALGHLANLRTLYLHINQITAIPEALGRLANLQALSLHLNQIPEIPESLGRLANLQALSLHLNQIREIPESFGGLVNLQKLYLHDNQITAIPEALGRLANLHTLSLHTNQITAIPEALGGLANLKNLYLDANRLMTVPKSLSSLKRLMGLYLHGNPGLGIPAEVLGATRQDHTSHPANPAEILEYYFRAEVTGRPLNEAKLILVGQGAVGKTSLVKRLIEGEFDPAESKTEGIKIDRWPVKIDGEEVQLNVWDFGGQEIMHATHQFFLTERSLYLLVLNGREGGEDAEAEYWLRLIESFGANSPVIIVLNKISEHAFDLNRSALLRKHPNIRDFVRTDCRDNIGIGELKAMILRETVGLDELRVRFPGEWFAVKDYLFSTDANFLSFVEYREVCSENGVPEIRYQEMLARYLNQLGIVLNYRNDPRLKHTHVLKPHWVTEGIYKILNSKKFEERHGEIRLEDLSGILPEDVYPDETPRFVIDLMKRFDLCFSFPGDDSQYLIPELLSKTEPPEADAFDLEKCLNFQYHYTVLPEGLLPRFITRTHHLSDGEPRWRSGVILKFEGCRALVKADIVDKKVFVSIAGDSAESRRRLLAVVRADLERIHREIKNLNPAEMVPLPELPNEVVSYNDLIVMEREGRPDIYKVVEDEGKTFKVTDLLNGVDLSKQRRARDTEGLNLFFSHAREDERYMKGLKTHLTILEHGGVIQSWSDREIGAGDNWEKEIMDKLNGADIILLLISSDFIASDFCYKKEMPRALERHDADEARAIPVIVRDCIWEGKAPFARLQVLPDGGKSVDLWENKDSAWRNVAEGIEKAAESLKNKRVG